MSRHARLYINSQGTKGFRIGRLVELVLQGLSGMTCNTPPSPPRALWVHVQLGEHLLVRGPVPDMKEMIHFQGCRYAKSRLYVKSRMKTTEHP